MAKFKTSLVSKYKEDKKRQEEQQKLKDKHNIKDNNVVVVEKANMTKFTVKMLIRFVKLIATICLLILAAIGLTTVSYTHLDVYKRQTSPTLSFYSCCSG